MNQMCIRDSVEAAQTLERVSDTQCIYHIDVPAGQNVRYVLLEEDITQGQRVEHFILTRIGSFGNTEVFYEGTTVGRRRICPVEASGRFDVRITSARDEVKNLRVTLY